jgi:hypothetical protein
MLAIIRKLFPVRPQVRQADQAIERARAAFVSTYPQDHITGAGIRAVDGDHIIVDIRYGIGRPGPRRYFAVSQQTLEVLGERPASEWWPRGLK